jgi:hypothetical protein
MSLASIPEAPTPPDPLWLVSMRLGRRGAMFLRVRAPHATEAALRAFETARETHPVGARLALLSVELVA